MVRLGKRLQCIHDLVDPGSVVADIGCDHALLSIALIESKRACFCYACDVAEGPLERAKAAIVQAGLEDVITPLLNDGICGLPQTIDTIIIAGMGFETIRRILLEGRELWGEERTFLLASHTDVEELRQFLNEQHFVIDEERIVFERHYYQIIKAHHDPQAKKMGADELLFGVHTKKEALFVPYWQKELSKCETILQRMPSTHERYAPLKERSERIRDMLQRYEETADECSVVVKQ